MNTGTHVIVLFRTCKRSTFYYFKKWYFLGFSHYLAFPCLKTYLPLSHQLPLSGWSCFDQSTSSGSDGLGRLQNLLLEVQALVCFLFYERKRETICQHLRCMAFSNRSRLYWNIQMSTGKHLSAGGGSGEEHAVTSGRGQQPLWDSVSQWKRLLTLGLVLGLSCSSFLAAASMAAAAPSSSFSAMTVGSSGSTHSVPATHNNSKRSV